MTIDLSTVKRIAVKHRLGMQIIDGDDWSEENFVWFDNDCTKFALEFYSMGAAEQKEKDIKTCEQFYSIEGIAQSCAEAIRYNE